MLVHIHRRIYPLSKWWSNKESSTFRFLGKGAKRSFGAGKFLMKFKNQRKLQIKLAERLGRDAKKLFKRLGRPASCIFFISPICFISKSSTAEGFYLPSFQVSERRLRPIYDWLDNGNNKKALQEADKVWMTGWWTGTCFFELNCRATDLRKKKLFLVTALPLVSWDVLGLKSSEANI